MLVYILYSPKADIFYTGFTTTSIEERLKHHLDHYYDHKSKFTSSHNDWEVYVVISCKSVQQAREIESHIKRMKSRRYIQNLKRYPEIIEMRWLSFR